MQGRVTQNDCEICSDVLLRKRIVGDGARNNDEREKSGEKVTSNIALTGGEILVVRNEESQKKSNFKDEYEKSDTLVMQKEESQETKLHRSEM